MTELTPGSEIVVRVRPQQPQPAASPATTGQAGVRGDQTTMRPARGVYAEFEGDEVLLVRRPQPP